MTIRERTQEHSHEFLVIQFLCFSCHGQWQSMRWSVDTLKIAAKQWPDFSEFTAEFEI
jgi:hypothetical protein